MNWLPHFMFWVSGILLGIAIGSYMQKQRVHHEAYVAVASGKVKCELITKADRTTEWVCEKR